MIFTTLIPHSSHRRPSRSLPFSLPLIDEKSFDSSGLRLAYFSRNLDYNAGGDVGSRVRTYIRSLVLRDMDRGGFSLGGVDMFDLGRSMRGGKKVVISFFLWRFQVSLPARLDHRDLTRGRERSLVKSVCVIGPSLTSRIRQIDPTFELCSPASRSINRGRLKRVPLQRCKPILSISSPISYLILPFLKQSNRSLPKNIPSNFSYRKKKERKEKKERAISLMNFKLMARFYSNTL